MDGQDWTPVIWTKKQKSDTTKRNISFDPTTTKWKKLESNDDMKPITRTNRLKKTIAYGKSIVQNRTSRNMSQADLANALSIPIQRVKQFEMGEIGVPDQIRVKLTRIFKQIEPSAPSKSG